METSPSDLEDTTKKVKTCGALLATQRRNCKRSYIDNLLQDTGMANTQELCTLFEDRTEWRKLVARVGRPGGRPK